MPEPVFSTVQVGRLFGFANTWGGATVVQRWILPGLLQARRVDPRADQKPQAARYVIEPSAVLSFIRAHPNAYDWQAITSPKLRAEAERIDQRDPLVPIDEIAAELAATPVELAALAKDGALQLLTRRGGLRGTKRVFLTRRSQIESIRRALVDRRRAIDPVAALEALLDAESQAPKALPSGTQVLEQVTGAAVAAVQRNGLPPRLKFEERRCPRCGATRTTTPLDDGAGFELSCMSCGQSDPLVDPAAEARREALRLVESEAIAAESMPRRGRPPRALVGH